MSSLLKEPSSRRAERIKGSESKRPSSEIMNLYNMILDGQRRKELTEEDACIENEGDRHCAFCLNIIPAKDIQLCGKCHRRAYCSRQCQTSDWTRKGTKGQGHKHWCSYLCGEEDLDWKLINVEGKGLAVVANRVLPSNYALWLRVMARRMSLHQPLSEVSEDCDANAHKLSDASFEVMVIHSKREIQPGEEIVISFSGYNEAYELCSQLYGTIPGKKYLESFEDSRAVLKSRWGITCPEDCLCFDSKFDLLVTSKKKAFNRLFFWNKEGKYSKMKALHDLKIIRELVDNHENMRSNVVDKAFLFNTGFKIAIQMRKTFSLAQQYIKESYELLKTVYHPLSELPAITKTRMDDPRTSEEYLALEIH